MLFTVASLPSLLLTSFKLIFTLHRNEKIIILDFFPLFFSLSMKPLSPSLKKAATVLKSDGVVALPTDTLYGVAALASSTEGIGKLYDLKRRDGNKPVAICVSSIADIHK